MSEQELSDDRGLVGVPAPRDGVVGTTLLIVSDQDRSREFYVSVLGASAVRERDPVVLRLGGMWLILNEGGDPTPDKPAIIAAPPADRSRFHCALNLRVADVHATWQQLNSAGAEFFTGPIDRGPEIRCYLHDPDGHLIEIGQGHATGEPADGPTPTTLTPRGCVDGHASQRTMAGSSPFPGEIQRSSGPEARRPPASHSLKRSRMGPCRPPRSRISSTST